MGEQCSGLVSGFGFRVSGLGSDIVARGVLLALGKLFARPDCVGRDLRVTIRVLRFRVWRLGLGAWVWGVMCGVRGAGCGLQGVGCGVWGVWDAGCAV